MLSTGNTGIQRRATLYWPVYSRPVGALTHPNVPQYIRDWMFKTVVQLLWALWAWIQKTNSVCYVDHFKWRSLLQAKKGVLEKMDLKNKANIYTETGLQPVSSPRGHALTALDCTATTQNIQLHKSHEKQPRTTHVVWQVYECPRYTLNAKPI